MAKNDVATRVSEMLKYFLDANDLCIYKIDYKKLGKGWNLDIYIDKNSETEDDFVSIEECEKVSKFLSDKLDKEDIIPHQYTLSVNSPGLDRELINEIDFIRYKDRAVEVKLYENIDGLKQFEGTLLGLEDGIVLIKILKNNKDELIKIPKNKIAKINLAVVF